MDISQPEKRVSQSTTTKRAAGVYLLPNLLTTAGLFAGFYAMILAIHQRFDTAALAIFAAMVMDGLDGRVARLTNTQSEFGLQYDSLCDMVSFGLAPALLIYQWALIHLASDWGWMTKLGWLSAFIYVAGTALRLARFNVQQNFIDRRYFQGLPSPAAAATMAGLVWVSTDFGLTGRDLPLIALSLATSAGLLMVSKFRYYSFKDIHLKNRLPFFASIIIVLSFTLVAIDPPKLLFILAICYLASGPLVTLFQYRQRLAQRHIHH